MRFREHLEEYTYKCVNSLGKVNRMSPARLVDVVSNLMPFTRVVVKYPGWAAEETQGQLGIRELGECLPSVLAARSACLSLMPTGQSEKEQFVPRRGKSGKRP
jgi:hypothetical protein